MGVIIVALLAEGVDRNIDNGVKQLYNVESPSSRRAWIEIWPGLGFSVLASVALLAEGVDRNKQLDSVDQGKISRPPRGGRG